MLVTVVVAQHEELVNEPAGGLRADALDVPDTGLRVDARLIRDVRLDLDRRDLTRARDRCRGHGNAVMLVGHRDRRRWYSGWRHGHYRDLHGPIAGWPAKRKLNVLHIRPEPDKLELPVEDERAVAPAADHAAGVPPRMRQHLASAIVSHRRRLLDVVVRHGVEVGGRFKPQNREMDRGAVAVGDETRRKRAAVALDHDVCR